MQKVMLPNIVFCHKKKCMVPYITINILIYYYINILRVLSKPNRQVTMSCSGTQTLDQLRPKTYIARRKVLVLWDVK